MVSPRPSLLLPSPSFFRKRSVPGENRLVCLLPPALPSPAPPVPSPLHSGLDHQTLVCSQPFAASLHGWPRHLCSKREVLSLSSNLLSPPVFWMARGAPPPIRPAAAQTQVCPTRALLLSSPSGCPAWTRLPVLGSASSQSAASPAPILRPPAARIQTQPAHLGTRLCRPNPRTCEPSTSTPVVPQRQSLEEPEGQW